jgi:hypothetical protein
MSTKTKLQVKHSRSGHAAPSAPSAHQPTSTGKRRRPSDADTASRTIADTYERDTEETAALAPMSEEAVAAGFGAAFSKIMSRNVTTDNPVMAKRHTAAAKLSEAERAKEKEEKQKIKQKKVAKRAHLLPITAYKPDFEKQLKRVATKGGT